MGTSPSGKVFYGFALVDEEGEAVEPDGPWKKREFDSLNTAWEEYYIEQKGGLQEPEGKDYRTPKWDKWRADRIALLKESAVDVELAGSEYNLISIVVLRESYVTAEWSEIKPITSPETKPEWDSQLREWCEIMGLEYRQPGWFVASLYF